MKTLSITIICKDEERNLERLLPQLSFADEIVVVDTGSSDNSVEVAKRYANVYFYKWRDDFAKARNYAISKATSEYIMWLDCDDDLPDNTVSAVKTWLADDSKHQNVVYLKYRMGANSQFWFWRERIIERCSECRFKGFIHEAITPFGQSYYIDCDVVHTSVADHSKRNLHIYKNALANGKRFTLRDKYYYARTLLENGLQSEATSILTKVCKSPNAYVIDRVNGYKLLARTYIKQGGYKKTLIALSQGVALLPPDAETCCLFGDVYYFERNYVYAARWYEFAVNSRSQVGFVNDYYKRLYPYIQLSVCWWRQGDIRQSKFYHRLAKSLDPTNAVVINNDKWF